MIFKTTGDRVEMEYQRGSVFFVRLPLLGDVLWTSLEGWQFWPWRQVRAQLEREDEQRRRACVA